MTEGLQEKYAPNSICFGCGPANKLGLRIKSVPNSDNTIVECDWMPQAHHEAFPGMLNGGIIGALLDCHSNWTAAWHLMNKMQVDNPPCTVTADFHVRLLKPTPSNKPVHLVAKVLSSKEDRAEIEAELFSGEKKCATCKGTFVAVKEGHPAYHRWG